MSKELAFLIGLFHEQARHAQNGKCTTCGGEIGPFGDELSQKEYYISGMCQACQDQVFADQEEDDGQPDDLTEHEDFAQDNPFDPEDRL